MATRGLSLYENIKPIIKRSGVKKFTKEKGEDITKTALTTEELQKRYEKGVRLKNRINLMEKSIQERENRIEELSKTDIFKEMKKNLKLIKGIKGHIKFHYKKFLELYD